MTTAQILMEKFQRAAHDPRRTTAERIALNKRAMLMLISATAGRLGWAQEVR